MPLLVAALLTIPAIAIEQSDVGQPWDTIASVLNWVIWTAFLAEAILMLRVVDDRWRWVREHPLEVAKPYGKILGRRLVSRNPESRDAFLDNLRCRPDWLDGRT